MRIDLHTHSTASDGTSSPAELVRDAAAAGLDVLGLTDHDTTAGWAPALAAMPAGLTLVRGAELSCRWFGADGASIGLHLLAYLFDPAEPEFAAAREKVRRSRLARAETMVGMLAADGAGVRWDDVLRIADGGTVGRPHVARALVEAGVVADVPAAFASRWLGARYRVPKLDVEVFEAVRLVRGAGGVAVFAHPKASRRGRVVSDAVIADLAAAGVAGLEVDHADHDESERAALRGLAADLGLFATGSSDYHGTNKNLRLGDNATTTAQTFEQLVAASSGVEPVGR